MIAIIGAGPAGSHAGALLAKRGFEVVLFEEHDKPGEPVQCTGIVTDAIHGLLDIPEEVIVNRVGRARIYAPSGRHFNVHFRKPDLVIDRRGFDQMLAERAVMAGAKLCLSMRYIGRDKTGFRLLDKRSGKSVSVKASVLIGADGPLSSVAKSHDMSKGREFYTGIQARARHKNDSAVEFFPYIGKLGWVVPESRSVARIGVLARGDAVMHFEAMLQKKGIRKQQIMEMQGGVVPIYNRGARVQNGMTYLVGDSACQVKASTGGGIVQGLIAAKILAESIGSGRSYAKGLVCLNKELRMHLMVRRMLDRFSMQDWDNLIDVMGKRKNQDVLARIGRDSAAMLCAQLLLRNPQMILYGRYLV